MIEEMLDETDSVKQGAIIISLIKTGARSGELSSLLRKNVWIDTKTQHIVCSGMKVEKQRTREVIKDINGKPLLDQGEKQYVIMPKVATRRFQFPLKERYSRMFMDMVEEQTDSEKPVFPYNRYQCYYNLSTIGAEAKGMEHKNDWWRPEFRSPYFPHLYRHLRASQLCTEYSNYRSNAIALSNFFGWSDINMALFYINLSLESQQVKDKEIRR